MTYYYTDTPKAYNYKEDELRFFNCASDYFVHLDEKIRERNFKIESKVHFLVLDSSYKGDLKGRIAILDYQVMNAKDYYERVDSWHKKYFWNIYKGKNNSFTGAPSVRDILEVAYGKEQSNVLDASGLKTTYNQKYARLVRMILSGEEVPEEVIRKMVFHASNPLRYSVTRMKVWTVTCAMINGRTGGQKDIMLDVKNRDRNYLFGRLLAYANYVERLTFKPTESGRETNAIRYMADFAKRPATTWNRIYSKLQPYLRKLNRDKRMLGEKYRKEIDAIMEEIAMDEFTDEKLENAYLLGFSSQSMILNRSYKSTEIDEDKLNEN